MNYPEGGTTRCFGLLLSQEEPNYILNIKKIKVLPAKAGQFYLFCERTLHGSTDNITNEKRWAIGGRIMKADTKVFTENMLKNGLNLEVYGVRKIKLDKWKPVLVRGKKPIS